MNNRIFKIVVEVLWIVMAIFCLCIGIYYHTRINTGHVWLFYALSVVSLGMFAVRFMQRRNEEKRNRRNL